jgi:hypothetical protein
LLSNNFGKDIDVGATGKLYAESYKEGVKAPKRVEVKLAVLHVVVEVLAHFFICKVDAFDWGYVRWPRKETEVDTDARVFVFAFSELMGGDEGEIFAHWKGRGLDSFTSGGREETGKINHGVSSACWGKRGDTVIMPQWGMQLDGINVS